MLIRTIVLAITLALPQLAHANETWDCDWTVLSTRPDSKPWKSRAYILVVGQQAFIGHPNAVEMVALKLQSNSATNLSGKGHVYFDKALTLNKRNGTGQYTTYGNDGHVISTETGPCSKRKE